MISFKYKDPILFEGKITKDVTENFINVLDEHDYQDVFARKHRGKVTSIVQTVRKQLKANQNQEGW